MRRFSGSRRRNRAARCQSFATSDSAWREIVVRVIGARRLGWRRSLKRLLTQGRNAREQMDVRRMGYFRARTADLTRLGFRVVFANRDIPQKVQFNSGPVVALRV